MSLARRKPLARGRRLETRTPLRRGKPLKAKRLGIRAKVPKRIARRAEFSPRTEFVRSCPCVSCGRQGPSDAAHITLSRNQKGVGMKVSDEQIVPLCRGPRGCHRQWDTRAGKFAGRSDDQRYELGAAWVSNISERWALFITPADKEHGRELERIGLGTMGIDGRGRPVWHPTAGVRA